VARGVRDHARGLEQMPWLYDPLCALAEAAGLRRWRDWLAGGARGLTLDVGCGTGRTLPRFGPHVRAVGLDPSAEVLRRARRRAPRVPLVRGNAEQLPFRDGAFDTVVSGLVFCSVPEPARGLAEVRRVLRRDGELRMLEHVRSTRAWMARLQDWIQPCWTRLSGGCHPNRATERAVQAAGFTIGERRACGTFRRFSARPGPRAPPSRSPRLEPASRHPLQ
jgi:ubiquinone/menaquinone biosynthesis C-methylase UbiE